jgi:hypothetical protein
MQPEARSQIASGPLGSADAVAEAPFYIASIGPSSRPRSTLKDSDHDYSFDRVILHKRTAGSRSESLLRDTRAAKISRRTKQMFRGLPKQEAAQKFPSFSCHAPG